MTKTKANKRQKSVDGEAVSAFWDMSTGDVPLSEKFGVTHMSMATLTLQNMANMIHGF